jgi:phenylalanyl-tRNA synthetase beta chain
MKASYRWLKDLVPGLRFSPEELSEYLALRGAPVEGSTSPGASLADVIVARVVDAARHPNADRLSVCTVDAGGKELQVVCGAPNVRAGGWYPFAPVGAVLPGDFQIRKAKIRGEVSEGMLCSAKELRLGTDHSGIMELHGDFKAGASFVDVLGLDDWTLEVEVTANRGDLLSHVGLARELASAGAGAVAVPALPGVSETPLAYLAGSPRVEAGAVSVEIRDPDLCPRYLGAILRGVRVGPSPIWLQQRLRAAGARPINNVVDATNYVMLELGQPLHAFDLGKLRGSGIVVRRAGEGEREFTTLDDETRRLGPDMLMICDLERPVAVAGVMGGLHSEVGPDTRDVLLECAWFAPKSIRATRRALGMSTDASYRFERGIDAEAMERALERCLHLIVSVAGGTFEGPVLDCGSGRYEAAVVALRLSRIERLLGIPFTPEQIRALLEPLGFQVLADRDGVLDVRIPGFRAHDVTREVDLIEEVARTHGYDRFPADLGAYRPGTVPDHPLFQLEDELRARLAARGLFEAQTPAFVPAGEGDVEVANPLATTEPFVRRALLPSLLRRVAYNLARGNRDVRLFELGTSFRRGEPGAPPVEQAHLAVALTGRRRPVHWSHAAEPLDVWDLKALAAEVADIAYRCEVSVVSEVAETDGLFVPGLGFELKDGVGGVVGRAGKIREDRVDLPAWAGDVWGLELTLPQEPDAPPTRVHTPLAQYPSVERDLALLVPDHVAAGAVLSWVRAQTGPFLEDASLFDLYVGDGVPQGVRSLAFRLRFRDREGTLKDEQVDAVVQALLPRLSSEFGVVVRG